MRCIQFSESLLLMLLQNLHFNSITRTKECTKVFSIKNRQQLYVAKYGLSFSSDCVHFYLNALIPSHCGEKQQTPHASCWLLTHISLHVSLCGFSFHSHMLISYFNMVQYHRNHCQQTRWHLHVSSK